MITILQINYITYMLSLSFHPLLLKRFNGQAKALFSTEQRYAAKEDGGLCLPKVDWYHSVVSLSQLSKIIRWRFYVFWTDIGQIQSPKKGLLEISSIKKLYAVYKEETPTYISKSNTAGRCLAKWVERASHVLRLCSGPRFDSLCCMSLSLSLPVSCHIFSCSINKAIKGQKKKKQYRNYFKLVKGSASRLYSLMRQSHPPKLDRLRRAWEEDIGGCIAMETWEEIVWSWYKTSREVQTSLITYKDINKRYWTPCKMARLKYGTLRARNGHFKQNYYSIITGN